MSKQNGKLTRSQRVKYGFSIVGIIILMIIVPTGTIVGIVLALKLSKKKKQWIDENLQNEQRQVPSRQVAAGSAVLTAAPLALSKLPNIPEQTQDVKLTYREVNGGDLFDICKQRDAMSLDDKFASTPIAVRNSYGQDKRICVLYALQYGKTFEDRTYAVWLFVDENGETGNAPFTGQIKRNADGSTEILFVDNDDFAEVIFGDMNARMEQEMKAKGIPTASDEEQNQSYNGESVRATNVGKGRLGRLKSKLKSGAGESTKTRVSAFISVAVMYAVILIVGLVMYLLPIRTFYELFGGGNNTTLKIVLTRVVCLAYLLVTPSFLLYFGAHNPFNFKKAISIPMIVVGIIGMVACDVYGIVTIPRFATNPQDTVNYFIVSKFIPIALGVSTVAYILVYLVWCKGLSSKWYASMSYVTTLIFPIATALILAVIALYIVWTLLMWLISAIRILFGGTAVGRGFKQGWTGKGQSGGGYQIIDENGYTRTLTPYEGNRYRDDTGSFWISDDGGNSFRRD